MYDAFRTGATAVSSEVYRFATRDKALQFIVDFMKKEGIEDTPGSYAVWAGCPLLEGVDRTLLAEKIPGLKFGVTRESATDAKIGVSQVDWGLANTGTVVQDSTAIEQRLVSTLPQIHVALLRTENILPDLPALFSRIDPRKASYIAFITGPSRTADIERVLTIGVHGPERLVIVVVDEHGGVI
jgi:L-lactate dehydrogenase complex protein LldG